MVETLKQEEIKSGGAECLKHAILIGDRTLANQLTNCLRKNEIDKLESFLPHVIDLKRRVVCEDATEKGKRAILNFGHTFAHALEARSQKKKKIVYCTSLHMAKRLR